MPSIELSGPALICLAVLAIAAIHLAYYRWHAGRNTQHVIDVVDCTTQLPGDRSAGETHADHAGRRPTVLDDATSRIAAELGGRVFVTNDIRLRAVEFVDVLICTGDLTIEGACSFFAAVKVGGDLIVNGTVRFLKPVVVNGNVKVQGTAHFCEGMVAKGEVDVAGCLEAGSPEGDASVVAVHFKTTGQGKLTCRTTEIATTRRAA
jgi:hypothetical protein